MKRLLYRLFVIAFLTSLGSCKGMYEGNNISKHVDVNSEATERKNFIENFLKDNHNEFHYDWSLDIGGKNFIIAVGKDCVCTAETLYDNGKKKCKICFYKQSIILNRWELIEENSIKNLVPVGIRIVETENNDQMIIMLCNDLSSEAPAQCFIKLNTQLKVMPFNKSKERIYLPQKKSRGDKFRIEVKYDFINDDQFDVSDQYIICAQQIMPYTTFLNNIDGEYGLSAYRISDGERINIKSYFKDISYPNTFNAPIKKIAIGKFYNVDMDEKQEDQILLTFTDKCRAHVLKFYDNNNKYFVNNLFDTIHVHPKMAESNDSNFDMDYSRKMIFYRGKCSSASEGRCSELVFAGAINGICEIIRTFGAAKNKPSIFDSSITIESIQSYDGKSCIRVIKPGIFTRRKETVFNRNENFEISVEDRNKLKSYDYNNPLTEAITKGDTYTKGRDLPINLYPVRMLSTGGVVGVNNKKLIFLDSTTKTENMEKIIEAKKEGTLINLQKAIDKDIIEKTKNNDSWLMSAIKKFTPYAIAAGITYIGYKGLQYQKQKSSSI